MKEGNFRGEQIGGQLCTKDALSLCSLFFWPEASHLSELKITSEISLCFLYIDFPWNHN